VRPITEWARAPGSEPPELAAIRVEVIDIGGGVERPTGPRFGTLVHAVLAAVALDGSPLAIADTAELQARVLGASPEEIAAAREVVAAVLAHPFLARAREAHTRGRCRRETPVAGTGPDGQLLEGVLDLAFEDELGWTILDFKTTAQAAGMLDRYRRQVATYAWLVRRATGRDVRAVLLRA
jgi:ATP-dependent exoDNAse (exonuclease V) beta subunit